MSLLEDSTPLILVADDESTTRLMMDVVLQENGFRVVTASDGKAAYELFCELQPDGVILDLEMPLKSGLEVCREIRGHPDLVHTPVMISTSHDDLGSIDEAFAAGATDFITKPHNLALLPRRVRYLLKASLAMEKLRRTSALKNEFMHNISHELRTPLNGVIGMVDLLSATELSVEQQDYCDTLKASGRVLLNIIGDTLDYSKLAAGGIQYENRAFLLDELLQGSLDMILHSAQEKDLQLSLRLANNTPAEVRGDFLRIKQVLTNLLSNAIKFTSSGSVELAVSAPKPDHIEFTVSDTGVGITPASQTVIFEPFQQADGTTTRNHGGTGLGLTIARSMMQEMGGDLILRSSTHKGSCFVGALELPTISDADFYRRNQSLTLLFLNDNPALQQGVVDVMSHLADKIACLSLDDTKVTKPDIVIYTNASQTSKVEHLWRDKKVRFLHIKTSTESKPNPSLENSYSLLWPFLRHKALSLFERPKTASWDNCKTHLTFPDLSILVAEDNLVNQKIISKMLAQLGLNCTIVENGRDAVEQARRAFWDLILMDCAMPVQDGYSATREIRTFEENEDRQSSVIIALTANAMEEDVQRCIEAGMTEHLSKPCSQTKLSSMLTKYFTIEK